MCNLVSLRREGGTYFLGGFVRVRNVERLGVAN